MKVIKNRIQLVGNLGQDPKISQTVSGKKLARLSLATTDVFKRKSGDEVKETQWHNLVAWEGLANIAEKYLKKGSEIVVDGRLSYNEWEDKEGITRKTAEITINDILMLGRNRK